MGVGSGWGGVTLELWSCKHLARRRSCLAPACRGGRRCGTADRCPSLRQRALCRSTSPRAHSHTPTCLWLSSRRCSRAGSRARGTAGSPPWASSCLSPATVCSGGSHLPRAADRLLATWGYSLPTWGYSLSTWGYSPATWGYSLATWGYSLRVTTDYLLRCYLRRAVDWRFLGRHRRTEPANRVEVGKLHL